MNTSITPSIMCLSLVLLVGCETSQFFAKKPGVEDIEPQIRDRFHEISGERHLTGPNITELYHYAHNPVVRLKAIVDSDGKSEIQLMLREPGSNLFGFKEYHAAITSEMTELEIVKSHQNTHIGSGSSIGDESSFGAHTERVTMWESATAIIPLDYLRQKTDSGFMVIFKGEHGDTRVGITAEYVQAFRTKLEAYL